jgi:hypothetical protein
MTQATVSVDGAVQNQADTPTIPACSCPWCSQALPAIEPSLVPGLLGPYEVFPAFCYTLSAMRRGAGPRLRLQWWR